MPLDKPDHTESSPHPVTLLLRSRLELHPARNLAPVHIWAAAFCGSFISLSLCLELGKGEKETLLGAVDTLLGESFGQK